jgi:hypothetical protein
MAKDSKHAYSLIDQNTVNGIWNGWPYTVLVSQNIGMPQTPNGTTVLAATNQATQNNQGMLSLTSGGAAPQFLNPAANAFQPTILINNWLANNLSITNISPNNETPILVQVVGPGVPGISPLGLPIGLPGVPLAPGQCAQGNASPQFMQLLIQSTAQTLGIIALIGGPPDATGNNGYVFAVNAAANTGPGTGVTPPPGYYATTMANSYPFQFNWGSSLVFVANMSPSTAQEVTVLMRAL